MVTENPPQGSMRVRCAERDGRPAGVFVVYDKRDVRPLSAVISKAGNETESKESSTDKSEGGKTPAKEKGRIYKVGNLVEASPFFKESQWRPCRVAELTNGGGLRV